MIDVQLDPERPDVPSQAVSIGSVTEDIAMRIKRKFGTRGFKIGVSIGAVCALVVLEMSWTSTLSIHANIVGSTEQSGLPSDGFEINFSCFDRKAQTYNRIEDIFCIALPPFLPELKNPCFHDYLLGGQKKLRCLPYFYIIGMDKSGTTDLHSRMIQHPFIMPNKGSLGKETGYWSWGKYGIFNKELIRRRKVPFDDFLNMFSETAQMIEETNIRDVITGDATPMDFWDFRMWPWLPQNKGREEPVVLTPHLLKHIYGRRIPKFLIQFREPIERLYSDYIFLGYGKTPLEFHKHSFQAIEMFNNCLGNFSRRFCFFSEQLYRNLPTRIHLGCYGVFLREWFRVFPRETFLITTTDEYEYNTSSTLARVFHFLDLPFLSEIQMIQITKAPRRHVTKNKHGDILPETVAALRGFYDNCNKETADILNDARFLWLTNH